MKGIQAAARASSSALLVLMNALEEIGEVDESLYDSPAREAMAEMIWEHILGGVKIDPTGRLLVNAPALDARIIEHIQNYLARIRAVLERSYPEGIGRAELVDLVMNEETHTASTLSFDDFFGWLVPEDEDVQIAWFVG